MKKILVLLLLLQAVPSFSANFLSVGDNVCDKYGCTLPPIPTALDYFHAP